jgi:coproporphyrinogen III oxidase
MLRHPALLATFRTAQGPVAAASSATIEQTPAADVLSVLEGCQTYFKDKLEALRNGEAEAPVFRPVSWQRNAGENGGGTRLETSSDDKVFNRATINLSGVHYRQAPKAPIDSASALSVIMHPRNPYAPSMHFHMSYIEVRDGEPYWRMIADLNPAIEDPKGTSQFEDTLRSVIPKALYEDGKAFGDKYFYIPTLERTRGVSHMFLAKLEPGKELSPAECVDLARKLAEKAIGIYCDLVQNALQSHSEDSIAPDARSQQLAYHTLYFFQVLMLDHGTTTGLLAHSDNDVGTLGSLPQKVDGQLLTAWMGKLSSPQDMLLKRILDVLPAHGEGVSELTPDIRKALCDVVRSYYKEDMVRTKLQGSMDMQWWASLTANRLAAAS